MNQPEKLFTAGQFAKIHGIHKRTLMYYDDIGLLAPAARGENGYRYYSYNQSSPLEILLSLRELDVSIQEIKQYMQNRSPETLLSLLTMKINEAQEKIARIQTIESMLKSKRDALRAHLHVETGKVSQVQCEEKHLYVSRPHSGDTYTDFFRSLTEHFDGTHPHYYFNNAFGTMLSMENVRSGKFESCDYIYTELENGRDVPPEKVHIRPAGRYVQIYHKGTWDTLPQAYDILQRYEKENGLYFTGYSYEEGVVDEMAINRMEDYITKICMRIEAL